MTPYFQIIAEGQDVTDVINDRLLSLQVIDEDGYSADRIEIKLDDRDNVIELPKMGYHLDVSMGMLGRGLAYMGRYVVNGVKGTYPKRSMTISAMAADMAGSIRNPKTRDWKDVTIDDIVRQIAGENNLTAQVGSSVSNHFIPYIAQTSESDLHFLTRISLLLDATAKAAGGYLIVHQRGENQTAAGDAIVPYSIDMDHVQDLNWKLAEREEYKTVEAEWGDVDGGALQKAVAGSGDPKRRLRHVFATQAEAQRAADAELAMADRTKLSVVITLTGFEPSIFAGGQITVKTPPRSELSGDWHISRVEHNLNGSLWTKIAAVKAFSGGR